MKPFALLVCLLLLYGSSSIQAQGLAPSTVRQIFSLEKGDSLEYHVWTISNPCGNICNWYELKIVDSIAFSLLQDTEFIFFQNQLLYFDSANVPINICGQCTEDFIGIYNPYAITASKWSVFNLDSSIIPLEDTIIGQQTGIVFFWDSIYGNSFFYDGSKQNAYNIGWGDFTSANYVYVDSAGIAYQSESAELADNNTEQLIYYHKANGSTWGTPFVYTSITNLSNEYNISVYPNPVEDRFVIQTDHYQNMHFELYDVLSKQVMNLNLTGMETNVNRNKLPAGIYCWQITDGVSVMKTGKLVLE